LCALRSKVPSAFTGYSFHVIEALIVFANEVRTWSGCVVKPERALLKFARALVGVHCRQKGGTGESALNDRRKGIGAYMHAFYAMMRKKDRLAVSYRIRDVPVDGRQFAVQRR